MSKILASIADAEDGAYLHPRSRSQGDQVTSRATAARAEHAEIVAALRRARDILNRYGSVSDLDSILSRVGGGA